MQPTSRRNSLDASPPTSPRAQVVSDAASPSPTPPSAPPLSLEPPISPRATGPTLPITPISVDRLSHLLPPMVFHVHRFLERPEAAVLSTASKSLNAVTARTADPLLRAYLGAQRQAAAQPGESLAQWAPETTQKLLSSARASFGYRDVPVEPKLLGQPGVHTALWDIVKEKLDREDCSRHRERVAKRSALCKGWQKKVAVEAQEQLASHPRESNAIFHAARTLCALGRTRDAEQLLRWRLLWRPDDLTAYGHLADVLLQARQYDAAIETMRVRNELGMKLDRQTWEGIYKDDGACARADTDRWTTTKAPVARALLLQGHTWAAFSLIDSGVAPDPLTLTLIQYSVGHETEAKAAFTQIADPVLRAQLHAWRGNSELACKYMNAALTKEGDLQTYRRTMEVVHSPFFDPIREHPHWQNFLRRVSLTPEQLATVPFDISPADPETIRRTAELNIRRQVHAAGLAFATKPAQGNAAQTLSEQLSNLGRFEAAEQVLRWDIARDPNYKINQCLLGEVLLRAGRIDEALALADIVDKMFGNTIWGMEWRPRGLLLSGQAQAAYDLTRTDPELQAMAAHTLGLLKERERLIGQLHPSSYLSLLEIRAWAGQADEAFEQLDRALAAGEPIEYLQRVAQSPFIGPIRSDPRWPMFLRSFNMAPEQLGAIPLEFELPALPLEESLL